MIMNTLSEHLLIHISSFLPISIWARAAPTSKSLAKLSQDKRVLAREFTRLGVSGQPSIPRLLETILSPCSFCGEWTPKPLCNIPKEFHQQLIFFCCSVGPVGERGGAGPTGNPAEDCKDVIPIEPMSDIGTWMTPWLLKAPCVGATAWILNGHYANLHHAFYKGGNICNHCQKAGCGVHISKSKDTVLRSAIATRHNHLFGVRLYVTKQPLYPLAIRDNFCIPEGQIPISFILPYFHDDEGGVENIQDDPWMLVRTANAPRAQQKSNCVIM